MKKEYKKPELEIVKIEIENIITDSGTPKSFNMFGNPTDSEDWTNLPK